MLPWHRLKQYLCTRIEDRCRNPMLEFSPEDLILLSWGVILLLYFLHPSMTYSVPGPENWIADFDADVCDSYFVYL